MFHTVGAAETCSTRDGAKEGSVGPVWCKWCEDDAHVGFVRNGVVREVVLCEMRGEIVQV